MTQRWTTRAVHDPADLAEAARMFVDFNDEYGQAGPDASWVARRLETLVAAGDTSVLLVGEPAAGLAILRFRKSLYADADEAYLAEFYVRPAFRGRGIGTAFLDDVIGHARARGASYMDLTTTEADAAARHVYEKRGFDCHEGRGTGPLSLYYELDLE